MNITLEVKVDSEILEALVAIKDILTGDKQQVKKEAEHLTLDEFVTDDKAYTLEEVRAKLTELSRSGKREAVNKLIKSYGVNKLTDLPAQQFTDIMQKAGEL